MTNQEFDEILTRTLDDGRFSRAERKALRAIAAEVGAEQMLALRKRVFLKARDCIDEFPDGVVLDWLEAVLKAMLPRPEEAFEGEALFSPGEDCRNRIIGMLGSARRSVDICVFTITDDAISRAIFDAKRRGVALRIITDDDKAYDKGSDVSALERAGVPVRLDRTEAHMHHKFAIFDGARLLNGSYNWTRSAFKYNEENILVTGDPRLVSAFQAEFDQLWAKLG